MPVNDNDENSNDICLCCEMWKARHADSHWPSELSLLSRVLSLLSLDADEKFGGGKFELEFQIKSRKSDFLC